MNIKINFNSILTRVTIVFLITIQLFIISFISYFYYQEVKLKESINTQYSEIAKYTQKHRLNPQEYLEYAKEKRLLPVNNAREILDNSNLVISGTGYEVLQKGETYYMHLLTPKFRLLLKDAHYYENDYFPLYILIPSFIVFILSFLWIIAALRPLKVLKQEVQKFSQGSLDINCKSDKKDEIAELGNEFHEAAKKITLLLESRQLFLRTVMHELKTPIAKGRIVSELISDDKQKERSIHIYEKLNLLIDNFAKIEQVVSQNYELKKQPVAINNVIENSIDMLMLDKVEEKITYDCLLDNTITVDLELISLSFKNLIDNALKYSTDKKVLIKKEKNELLFISNGEKLLKPIEEYFKPFHNDTKSKNHGMGLGLYIVYSILQMHKLGFEYEHKQMQNTFKVIF